MRWRATLLRWIDGDTFVARVHLDSRDHSLGFHLKYRPPAGSGLEGRFRLRDYDAPEIRGPEKKLGRLALAHLEELIPNGSEISLLTWRDAKAGFGRWLGDIEGDDASLVETLIREGWGRSWNGRTPRIPFQGPPYPIPRDR